MKAIKVIAFFFLILGGVVGAFYLITSTDVGALPSPPNLTYQTFREQFEKDWEQAGDWDEKLFMSHCDLVQQLSTQYETATLNDLNTKTATEVVYKKIFDEWETSLKEDYEKTSYGSKNGYVYIVGSNYGTEDPYDRSDIGIYRKGKDVFIVGESYDSQNAKEDSFFESLGLVKPADAIK